MKEWKNVLEAVNLNFVVIQDLRIEGESIDDGCTFLAADFGNGSVCLATIDDPVILDKDNKEVKDMKLEIGPHFRVIGIVSGKLVTEAGSKVPKLCVWVSKLVERPENTNRPINAKPENFIKTNNTVNNHKPIAPTPQKKISKFFGNW